LYRILTVIVVLTIALVSPVFAIQTNSTKLENRINHLREKHDLRPYKISGKLKRVAQRRSVHLSKIHKLKHASNLDKRLAPASAVGEILGVGSSLKDVYRIFKHSPEHRAVMLSKTFRQQGAGHTRDRRGRLWVVVVFRKPA
jgi:uncharacterized protein YkwD